MSGEHDVAGPDELRDELVAPRLLQLYRAEARALNERFDRFESKLDRLIERVESALSYDRERIAAIAAELEQLRAAGGR